MGFDIRPGTVKQRFSRQKSWWRVQSKYFNII